MPSRISNRAARPLKRKQIVSGLDFERTNNLLQIIAIDFDESPIDFGVVVAGSTKTRQVLIEVTSATFVKLKIKGDKQFKAALIHPQPLDPETKIDTLPPIYDKPIVLDEYVPPIDIVVGPKDTFFDTSEFSPVEEIRPRLLSTVIDTPLGKRVAYQFRNPQLGQLPTPPPPPTKAESTTISQNPDTVGDGGLDIAFGDQPIGNFNVFPNSENPYYLLVRFDAPKTLAKSYGATLVVSFDDFKIEVPLSAQTGDLEVVLESTTAPDVKLGDSIQLPLRISNFGNAPAEVSFDEQSPKLDITCPKQTWTIAANQQAIVPLLITTNYSVSYNGLVPFGLKWKGTFGGSATDKRTLDVSLNLSGKPPIVVIYPLVSALQGSDAYVGVSIVSNGPTTSFYFYAEGLPDGVTMPFVGVYVPSGETKATFLLLKVTPHATVADGLSFDVGYSAHGGVIKGMQSVQLFIDNAFQIQPQEHSNWCWAATTSSIFDYYGNFIPQCELADRFTSLPAGVTCCDNAFPADCDHVGNAGDALESIGSLGAKLKRPLTMEEVIEQINANQPIAIRIEWAGGGAHAIVISGYVANNAGNISLIVEDPGDGGSQKVIDIGTLTTKYDDIGTWTHSYLTQPPPQ